MAGIPETLRFVFSILVVVMLIPFVIYLGTVFAPGFQSFIVKSGSMEPSIPTGSVIFTGSVSDYSTLSKGDVITFEDGKKFTTHRIYTIENHSSSLWFVTKGDANQNLDSRPVKQEEIVGKVILVIPYLGLLLEKLGSDVGIAFLIITPGLIIFLLELGNIISNIRSNNSSR